MATNDVDKLVYIRGDETGWGYRIYLYARCEHLKTFPPPTLDWDGLDAAEKDMHRWIKENGYEIYDNY